MPSSHLDSVPTPHSGHGSHLKSPSLPFCPLRPSASDVILTLGLNVVWREEGKMGDTGPILHRRNRKGGAGALRCGHTAGSETTPRRSAPQESDVASAAADTGAKALARSLLGLPGASSFRIFVFSCQSSKPHLVYKTTFHDPPIPLM